MLRRPYLSLQHLSVTCAPYQPLQHCHARAPWEHASLAARLSQWHLPLHLRPVALRKPRDMLLHWNPLKRGDRVQSHRSHDSVGAVLSGEAGSRAMEHGAALEPSSTGRRGPELRDTWQHLSPPQLGGGVRSYGHVLAPEPSLAGRQYSEPWDMWKHVLPLVLASCLYAGVPGL
jgi:hypothetical protein